MPLVAKRFLPSQEWSTWGLWFGGGFLALCAATFGRFGDNPPNCGTRHCEIPAYAGMVYYYFYDYRRPVAELSAAAAKCQIRPQFPRPPEDHSCEGRNLTIVCRQRRRLLGGDAAHV